MDKACKSNGKYCDYIKVISSGKRGSNTWVTFPLVRNNSSKDELILDSPFDLFHWVKIYR
jgi:hypothetical protein